MSPAARWPVFGTVVILLTVIAPAARAQAPIGKSFDLNGTIGEAAQRFELPAPWIRAVMGVESAFRVRAVSSAGAMGLMQVMPGTYADLRLRYGLGADPYHPRDNILAGAAYLREMYDRFGAQGFLAAYNAGPARYLEHVATGRPLPVETRAYVAKLSPLLRVEGTSSAALGEPEPVRIAARPSLFVTLGRRRPEDDAATLAAPLSNPVRATSGLFVVVSGQAGTR